VATVVCSARALRHIERALKHLRAENPAAALDAAAAIQSAVDHLASHPLVGRRVQGDVRELIISYGRTGYYALYRYAVATDEVRILVLEHQRELLFVP
jgi:plasmid stabilization system protein ParE